MGRALRAISLAVLLLAPSLLGGCLALRELVGLGPTEPHVDVREVVVTNANFRSIDMLVTLAIENPNAFALALNSLDYSVEALGLEVSRGRYAEKFSVPAHGKGVITLPLTVDTHAALKLLQAYFSAPDDLEANIFATVSFDTPFGALSMDFSQKQHIATQGK